jgi:hypothetical protein
MAINIPSGIFRGLGGGQMLQQLFLWQVAAQVMGVALAPEMQGLQEELFKLNPSLQLSVADAVAAAVRSYWTLDEAATEASLSGVNRERFQILYDSAGNPPGVTELLELWRRKVIPETGSGADSLSYEQGVREGQTKNKWIEPLKALKTALPAPESALEALLEGQTDEATARDLYEQWGGDPRYFTLMFDTRGSAPTPLEAASMARRGIIPWEGTGPDVVSFQQAFLEGPWRNKWLTPYQKVSEYLPPPRTVTALLRAGTIDVATATRIFEQSGLSPELTAAYVKDATQQRTQATRDLAKSTILSLYEEGRFTRQQALDELAKRGEPADVAEYEVQEAEWRRTKTITDHAVTKIHGLYVAHKTDKTTAGAALGELKLDKTQVDALFTVWDVERAATVKTLTTAQMLDLLLLGVGSAEVMAMLQDDGYTAGDAEALVRIKLKVPFDQALTV